MDNTNSKTYRIVERAFRSALPKPLAELQGAFTQFRRKPDLETGALLFSIVNRFCSSSGTLGLNAVFELSTLLQESLRQFLQSPERQDEQCEEIEGRYEALIDSLIYSQDTPEKELLPLASKTNKFLITLVTPDTALAEELRARHRGIEIIELGDPMELASSLEQRPPHLLVLDGDAYDANFIEMMAELKKQINDEFHIALFLGNKSSFETQLEALRAGIDYFFLTPLKADPLQELCLEVRSLYYGATLRILLVAESEPLANYYKKHLENNGLCAEVQCDPTRVLSHVEFFKPELIILNERMGELTGTELASLIRNNFDFRFVPIVFMGLDSRTGGRVVLRRQESDDYLTKPIQPQQLIATIKPRVIQARRHAQLTQALKQSIIEIDTAKQKAIDATQEKSMFIAKISHEIRTPLNGILGMGQFLSESKLTKDQADCVQLLNASGEMLLTIISDLLDFSKIEAGKVELENIEFDLLQVLDQAVLLYGHQAQQKQLALGAWVAHDVPIKLMGDPNRLKQVIGNLVNNAIKFTQSGSVMISAELLPASSQEPPKIDFRVRDSGLGMTDTQMAKLFKPFTQADNSTARKFGGTGLGLSISKNLIELMHGKIQVESTPLAGSTFSFQIPLAPADSDTLELVNLADQGTVALISSNTELKKIFQQYCLLLGVPFVGAESPDALIQLAVDKTELYAILVDCIGKEEDLDALSNILQANSLHSVPKIRVLDHHAQLDSEPNSISMRLPITQRSFYETLLESHNSFTDKTKSLLSNTAAKPSELAPHQMNKEKKVLVAEDNPTNQILMKKLLEKHGCLVDVVENGAQAVSAFNAKEYDIVFMDCQMPELDGYQAARFIRDLEKEGLHVPIIAITANALQGEREKCLAAGMDDYITKPVQSKKLNDMLTKFCHKSADDQDIPLLKSA